MIDDLVRLIKLGMITIDSIKNEELKAQVQSKLNEVI